MQKKSEWLFHIVVWHVTVSFSEEKHTVLIFRAENGGNEMHSKLKQSATQLYGAITQTNTVYTK